MRRWLLGLLGALSAGAAGAEPASVQAYMTQPQVKADARIAYGEAPAQVGRPLPAEGQGDRIRSSSCCTAAAISPSTRACRR